jgi:Tfp pilus assembly protein PilF
MSTSAEEHEQVNLTAAIDAYGSTLQEVLAGVGGKQPKELTGAVGRMLLARDLVARLLSAGSEMTSPPAPEELGRLVDLDIRLRAQAGKIVRRVGRERFADWRRALPCPEAAWWWSLEEVASSQRSHMNSAISAASWVLIAVALSFIIEITRRFLSGGTDLASTIIQGLLGFVVGGTIFQWARQLADGGSPQATGKKGLFASNTSRLITVAVLIIIAVAMEYARPRVARIYSDRGATLYKGGQVTAAIQNYQRAINLDPSYAQAHYNIGSAYEDVLDYEKAMGEYRNAILADSEFYAPYNNLARLYILKSNDYAGALKLLDKALSMKIEGDEQARAIFMYALYKNRGWADLGLKNYSEAKDDLQHAQRFLGDDAEAYCLLAQVSEAQKDKASAEENWKACGEFASRQRGRIDPTWVGLAREKQK